MSKGSGVSKIINQIFDPIADLENDDLGRSAFARQLLARLSEENCSPTIGLYGGWGVGKTSTLHLIEKINDACSDTNPNKLEITYVDAWCYEVTGDLTIPILIRLRELAGDQKDPEYSTRWKRVVGVVAQAGTDILLRKLLDLELGDVKEYAQYIQEASKGGKTPQTLKNLMDAVDSAQKDFEYLVNEVWEKKQHRRIVFLIDNLDRCSPENVVRLLESIRNFMDPQHLTWVFAMDSGVIASYIDKKYEDTKMDGNSYLDKIIPEQYHIPPITSSDMPKLQRFLARVLPENHNASLPEINLMKVPQLPEVLVPRRLLKTAHRFYRAYMMPSKLGAPAEPDTIFALILLYNSWPAFYERFSSDQPEHVRGILANFIQKEQNSPHLIPLPQKYLADRSLMHYMYHCFVKGQDPDATQIILAGSMAWLREAGLP
ncbi:MAG: hypothetical protein J0M11_07090 [Anaerolineae bacterium]|nr:hypothetical protein [Anaerolineae bacterium]MBN8655482.1 hypothetical protein [Anaerolineae bacterium]